MTEPAVAATAATPLIFPRNERRLGFSGARVCVEDWPGSTTLAGSVAHADGSSATVFRNIPFFSIDTPLPNAHRLNFKFEELLFFAACGELVRSIRSFRYQKLRNYGTPTLSRSCLVRIQQKLISAQGPLSWALTAVESEIRSLTPLKSSKPTPGTSRRYTQKKPAGFLTLTVASCQLIKS